MMHRVSLATYQVALAALIFSPPSLALGQAYYQGKTITILQGTSPGGSSDMLTRSVIPLLPQDPRPSRFSKNYTPRDYCRRDK